jgi:hypothetical protein
MLEKERQYRAVLAVYRMMIQYQYDFYDNSVLNGVFTRLVNVAARGVDADLKQAALQVARSLAQPMSSYQDTDETSASQNQIPLMSFNDRFAKSNREKVLNIEWNNTSVTEDEVLEYFYDEELNV